MRGCHLAGRPVTRIRWPDGTEMHGYGHYHETYEKSGTEWRIKSLTLTRLRVDFTPAPTP